MTERVDIVVVGAGHAGVEAAVAAARLGAGVVLLNTDLEDLAGMPCNPSIGGVGKGHLVREIDALGGVMGRLADGASIGTRTLNTSKGAAVRAPRAQCDRRRYAAAARELVFSMPGLRPFQGHAVELVVEDGEARGVRCGAGVEFACRAVVLATGTFLEGVIYTGLNRYPGGRDNARPARALARSLRGLGLELVRLKTGTSPRLDAATVDVARMLRQDPEEPPPRFSYTGEPPAGPFLPCYLTATTPAAHEAIRHGLDKSPLYTGMIEGAGPRYCPSIEDKVVRFPDRESHQLFLEPTGLEGDEFYVSGLATSLDYAAQRSMLAAVPGLERAVITRPGYAVVYDCLDPRRLGADLSVTGLRGLFAAGQLCGSSGYEEAAAQGLLAGVNAVRFLDGGEPFLPRRDQAYLGVLVDDLIRRWGEEPYRIFTARAEHRLALRADNADGRLTPLGHALGLVDETTHLRVQRKYAWRDALTDWAAAARLEAAVFERAGLETGPGTFPVRLISALGDAALPLVLEAAGRDEDLSEELRRALAAGEPLALEAAEVAVNDLRYAGYLRRHATAAEREERLARITLPDDLDYGTVLGLRVEAAQRLTAARPRTLGEARALPGVNPADIPPLLSYLKRRGRRSKVGHVVDDC